MYCFTIIARKKGQFWEFECIILEKGHFTFILKYLHGLQSRTAQRMVLTTKKSMETKKGEVLIYSS